jgi:hypothetical protein
MADDKVFANGNVDVIVLPANGIADINAPTAAEINAGLNVSNAIAWDGTTIPTASESSDVDDRSIKDKGNATSRGFAAYEGTLNFFLPKDQNDTSDDYGKAFAFFKRPRFTFIAVVRILQGTEGTITQVAAGEFVSVFKFIADTWVADAEGEDSYKYTVELLSQGAVAVNTLVKLASPATLTAAGSTALTVGDKLVVNATLGGFRANQMVSWASSDPTVATVTPNGVVIALTAGTANITANHPSASAASTPVAITVT